MRLIDADEFINYMESKCDYTAELDPIILAVFKGAIKEQPTAYDTDNNCSRWEKETKWDKEEKHDKEIYNKAIDDSLKELEKIYQHCVEMHDWNGQSAINEAIETIEQLKEKMNES